MMKKNITKEYLETAVKLITGPRANDYGDKVINHGNIAKLWSAYLDVPITGHDVAICMTLLKIARYQCQLAELDKQYWFENLDERFYKINFDRIHKEIKRLEND